MRPLTLHLIERLVWQAVCVAPFAYGLWLGGSAIILATFGALIVLFALHEPLHVVGFALVGQRAQLTVARSILPTLAVRVNGPMSIAQYRVGLLAPALAMVAACLIGLSLEQGWLTIAGLGGLATTSSDLALAWKTRSVTGIVRDHPTDLGILAG